MNLVEARAIILFAGRYKMHQMVISILWESQQAFIGEMLSSRLCQAYMNAGAGLVIHHAGQSNQSGLERSDDEYETLAI